LIEGQTGLLLGDREKERVHEKGNWKVKWSFWPSSLNIQVGGNEIRGVRSMLNINSYNNTAAVSYETRLSGAVVFSAVSQALYSLQ